jgi:hypothetical protein
MISRVPFCFSFTSYLQRELYRVKLDSADVLRYQLVKDRSMLEMIPEYSKTLQDGDLVIFSRRGL